MFRQLLIILAIVVVIFGCGKDAGFTNSGTFGTPGASGKAGSLARFAIVGNFLYALDDNDIVSFDISGATPALKNRVKVASDIETIYPYQDKLFVGSQTGMYAFSLADPAKPTILSMVSHVRACDPVVVQGNFAYVTLRAGTMCGGTNLLNVYNVTNFNSPVLAKSIPIVQPFGLGVTGNALYVTNAGGIRLFNIAQPDNPAFVSDIAEAAAKDVIPYNNTLLVQLDKGTALYDIANPLSPVYLSRINQ